MTKEVWLQIFFFFFFLLWIEFSTPHDKNTIYGGRDFGANLLRSIYFSLYYCSDISINGFGVSLACDIGIESKNYFHYFIIMLILSTNMIIIHSWSSCWKSVKKKKSNCKLDGSCDRWSLIIENLNYDGYITFMLKDNTSVHRELLNCQLKLFETQVV